MKKIKETAKSYKDMVYNAHTALREFYPYESLYYMPIKNLMEEVEFITPKLNEIMRRQQADRMKAEMTGSLRMTDPNRMVRRW